MVSRYSIGKRGHVQTEIRAALSLFAERLPDDIFLIPVRLNDCEIPESLADFQYINLFEKQGWSRLLQAIRHGIGNKESIKELGQTIKEQEESETSKRYIFVAMPFNVEMEDIYYYGILRAIDANDYSCERIDQSSFTGSILNKIKERIEAAAAVIADLTGANPNVYLELGYAWGKGIPALLLIQDAKALCFDVKDQRCIEYRSIKTLEELLTRELAVLKSNGLI